MIHDIDHIKNQLLEIIAQFVPNFNVHGLTSNEINKGLHGIMSHSQQAIAFVSVIEDEFDIEIDDEDINLDVFLDFSKIIELISKY